MKIITWNCSGGLRKKTAEVDSLEADIVIVQECEDPRQSTEKYRRWAGDYLWIGTSKNKGIGVFPKNGYVVEELKWSGAYSIKGLSSGCKSLSWRTEDLKLFLPFSINDEYTAVAVWTKSNDSEVFDYIGQLWKFLQIHRNDLRKAKTLIIGDFNSNSIWDKDDRWWNHTSVVNELKDMGISSLYHHQYGDSQGSEVTPTFYMYRKLERPYHIDYVFCSDDLLSHSSVQFGETNAWLKVSDHVPITLRISSLLGQIRSVD